MITVLEISSQLKASETIENQKLLEKIEKYEKDLEKANKVRFIPNLYIPEIELELCQLEINYFYLVLLFPFLNSITSSVLPAN